MRRCSQHYGPQIGVNFARKHVGWYTKGLHGSAEFRNAFNQEPDPSRARAMLRDFYAPWLVKAAPEGRLSGKATLFCGRPKMNTVFFAPHCCARAAV